MDPQTTANQKRNTNRANAQKSTGPRTPQGKARSRTNALKHGLLAKTILINEQDPDEDPRDFDQLLEALIDDFAPAGPHQRLLVERLAVCYWRLRRAHRFEARRIESLRRQDRDPPAGTWREMVERMERPPEVLPDYDAIDKMIRYESLIDRELHRTLQYLHRLQSQNPNGHSDGLHPAAPSLAQHEHTGGKPPQGGTPLGTAGVLSTPEHPNNQTNPNQSTAIQPPARRGRGSARRQPCGRSSIWRHGKPFSERNLQSSPNPPSPYPFRRVNSCSMMSVRNLERSRAEREP